MAFTGLLVIGIVCSCVMDTTADEVHNQNDTLTRMGIYYEKIENTYCNPQNIPPSYTTKAEAEAACSDNPACKIFFANGAGTTFKLCGGDSVTTSASAGGSTAYEKYLYWGCVPGQGQSGQSIGHVRGGTLEDCFNSCVGFNGCVGADYTNSNSYASNPSCILFGPNIVRPTGGGDSRVYCTPATKALYEVHISGELNTCAEDAHFGSAVGAPTLEVCEDKCNKDTKCGFYYYTENNYCTLYSACDQTRVPGSPGKTYRKVGEWIGPLDNVWADPQCPNFGNVGNLGSLEACQEDCSTTIGCSAINFDTNSLNCVLRNCSRPVPAPTSPGGNYRGYYFNSVSWQKEANDSVCTSEFDANSPNRQVSNQFQCQENCESTDGCVGIAYSHKIPFACYGCTNDTLEASLYDQQFGFYRNPNPVDCVWGAYGEWSTCSATCGGGSRTRTRAEDISAVNGGAECSGSATETESCNSAGCPVDCVWGAYGGWSTCSATCGGGSRTRTRPEDIAAAHGGAACNGSATETESCNSDACPVDCAWGAYGEWSSCSATCGGGERTRTRTEDTAAANGGAACSGSATEMESCNSVECQCKNLLPRETCQLALRNWQCGWRKYQRGCKATCRVCCGNIWRFKKCNRLKHHCQHRNVGRKCRKTCKKC